MPAYINLVNWTDQGIREIKESPERLEAAKAAFKTIGGEMAAFYLVMGEAPDEEIAARLALAHRLHRLGAHQNPAGLQRGGLSEDNLRIALS